MRRLQKPKLLFAIVLLISVSLYLALFFNIKTTYRERMHALELLLKERLFDNATTAPGQNAASFVASTVSTSTSHSAMNTTKAYDPIQAALATERAAAELLRQPVVNFHDYEYLRNPVGACEVSETEVLFVVPTAPRNFERRKRVRAGILGKYVSAPSNNATLLFFAGAPNCTESTPKIQSHLDDEFRTYGDLVQESFVDVYTNIRLKAVSMLRWAVTYCKHAKYVIRTDDDVMVNVSRIVSALKRTGTVYTDFILGNRKDGWTPVRNTSEDYLKYAVSEEEYPNSTYPRFALGGLLGYPLSTVTLLYQAALRTKPLWLDDVYITGICASRLKVPVLNDTEFVFQH
ncbi:unnamed protein product [Lymnaea stagnalis]|uniref:Hexosyltransferase n=1 Tax=Lymnaea stagnalis TaxID=6523 RepID=A0AAV2I017_LYMST